MQNQNMQPWGWGQPRAPTFPSNQVLPPTFSPAPMDQNQLISGYQQMYGPPPQPPSEYSTAQWGAAQMQHWQQWQQWQEKYHQWQAQYGKKYAESFAPMGQNMQHQSPNLQHQNPSIQHQNPSIQHPSQNMNMHHQNPNIVLPGIPISGVMKPSGTIPNPGYTSVNPPPPPTNAQPVPPPPPEEDKPKPASEDRNESKANEPDEARDNPEELSEAEKTFDIQFKQWEDQFNEWKKQNQDHPDKVQYREYEKKWEMWREQLLQRREQMRKKRLSKSAEVTSDASASGKNEEPKPKAEQDRNVNQGKTDPGSSNSANESQNPQTQSNLDPKPMIPYGSVENQGMFPHQKLYEDNPPIIPTFQEGNYPNLVDNRMQIYFDRENTNYINQPFAVGAFDRNNLKFGMEGNRDGHAMGSRVENCARADFYQRRAYGNGSFEDDRNFGPRFGNFDSRKPGQDRFPEARLKDGKFNPGRDSGPMPQLNEQAFPQPPRNFQERSFAGDPKPPFAQNAAKTNLGNSFKPKVPSLFDITVEKPPGLRSPGKDRKPKIWEQDNFDGGEKDDKNTQRNGNPWLTNMAWSNNSPWIKPWELDRVVAEKPPDANLRSDAWQKEPLLGNRREDKTWAAEMRKPDIDKSELSGYVGKILAKLGNFSALPPNMKDGNQPGCMPENSGKMDENLDKMKSYMQNQNWQGKSIPSNPNLGMFPQDGQNYQGNFSRDRFDASQGDKVNRTNDLFGRGDCDDRIRFDRPHFGRDNRREDRNIADCFRRDERGFSEEGKFPGNRVEDRFFGKGDRNSFDRTGGKFPLEDIDERMIRNRDRNRRGFEDRDDRPIRGLFDRDERRNRGSFDRFGRNLESGAKEMEWNPQVFDYSKGNQLGYRSQFSEPEENFRISTVVDYSHGENKQTFDYAHGEAKTDNLPVKSFDYGHGADASAPGHGPEKDVQEIQQWKKEHHEKPNDNDTPRSRSKSPQRPRSPRNRPRSRSRSPVPVAKNRKDSNSPSYRGRRSRSRDRFGRQNIKRNRRNDTEENSVQITDEDLSQNDFDVTTVLVEDLICSPGRESRPNKLVFIIRGLPGSGKTYVTKLIKDKETELGGDAPRILSLDDYFMTEVEKEVIDEETGRKMKKKVLEYEYESCAEPHYKGSLLKAFKKTISDGFFSFIIVDSVNEKTKDYEEMWSFAKQKGFQVYVAEMDDDVALCTKRNIHKRTEKEISDLAKVWEKTPVHYLRLDVRSLLQSDAITEVEMEVVSDTDLEKGADKEKEKEKEAEKDKDKEPEKEKGDKEEESKEDEEEDEPGESAFVKSRWDHFENSEQKLDRLDGLKRRREGFHATMQDYLQLPDDFDIGSSEPSDGKKKVRWADLEERRQQEKMRAIGFVVGQTDWSRMTDPTFGESALTRTKYI